MANPDPVTRLRLERGCEHLCRLGPRALFELLIEADHRGGGLPDILALLTDYQRLSPEMLRLVGGDRFPRQLDLMPRA